MRPVGEALARRGALGADAQRAVGVAGAVEDAQATVRLGERAAGGRERIALQCGDDAGGVFGFLSFLFLVCAGGGFADPSGFCFGLLGFFHRALERRDLCGAVRGCFLGLLLFVFFGALFGDGAGGGFVAAFVGPGEFGGCVGFFVLDSFGGGSGWDRLFDGQRFGGLWRFEAPAR